jgi:hypothetical protein
VVFAVSAAVTVNAVAGTLVVVPPGHENVEGNFRSYLSAHFPESGIAQHVFLASEFLGVPAGQDTIVSMDMRPDKTINEEMQEKGLDPWQVNFELLEVRLSTTDAANP